MDHHFIPSIGNGLLCAKCKKSTEAHGDNAECEACGKIGPVSIHYGTMLMCDECWAKEQTSQAESKAGADKRVNDARVEMEQRIAITKQMDEHIQMRTDVFNAKMTAIVELQKSISENAEIQNKPYFLADTLKTRFQHLQSKIFGVSESLTDMVNEQKAIHVYLNNLAVQLKQEERDKLHLQDISYQPKSPSVRKPSIGKPKPTKIKLDPKEVKKFALELGISEISFYGMCMAKQMQPEQAANMLRKSINEAKSETEVTE